MPKNRTTRSSTARAWAPRRDPQGRRRGRRRAANAGAAASSDQLPSAQTASRQPQLRTSQVGVSDELRALIREEIQASLGAMTLPSSTSTLLPRSTQLPSAHPAPLAILPHPPSAPLPGQPIHVSVARSVPRLSMCVCGFV